MGACDWTRGTAKNSASAQNSVGRRARTLRVGEGVIFAPMRLGGGFGQSNGGEMRGRSGGWDGVSRGESEELQVGRFEGCRLGGCWRGPMVEEFTSEILRLAQDDNASLIGGKS